MSTTQTFVTTNPATGRQIATYPGLLPQEVEPTITRSAEAFQAWKSVPLEERSELIRKLGTVTRAALEDSARLMSSEMGKPITEARAEAEKCARLCDYYAENGTRFLSPETVSGNDAARSYVRFDPLGIVLAVMPWNYPFWQVYRFAVPTLLAGNVGILKHASNVLGCAEAIAGLFQQAGFPDHVFTSVAMSHDELPEMVSHPEVKAVTLTGSEPAGRSIAQLAGKNLKKCVLELGGSDPFIVLSDVDLDAVLDQAVQARTQNTGQSCIAAKRFLVQREVYDDFVDGLAARMQSLPIGDPLDEQTRLGPLARSDLRDSLHKQVVRSVEQGARLVTGGHPQMGAGWFYEPTVLADITPEMTAFREETFGPVAAVVSCANVDEAVAFANASKFGLGGSIWTNDVELAEQTAARIESGSVFINAFTKSDPSLPFGGVKASGYGRELGEFGIREFVNIKTVWVDKTGASQ